LNGPEIAGYLENITKLFPSVSYFGKKKELEYYYPDQKICSINVR
jgi:hypothetical protein